jgi:hypothetical protein
MLLPAPEAHWLVETLALMSSETAVFSVDDHIELENSRMQELTRMLDRLGWINKGMSIAAEDFTDFNILHDLETMENDYRALSSEIFALYGHRHAGQALKDIPIPLVSALCCLVAAEAMSHLEARDLGANKPWIKLVRGLWSGWRSTMWYNTRFNKAYSAAVQRGVENEYGFNVLLDYYLIGDDSLLGTASEYEALRRLEAFDLDDLDSQPEKQMIDDEQAELTRIMHRKGGYVKGSLLRGLFNGASSDMQSGINRPGPTMAQSLKDQLSMWIRRGFDEDMANKMMPVLAKYWLTLRIRRDDGQVGSKNIPHALLVGAEEDGGLGFTKHGELGMRLRIPMVAASSGFGDALDKHVAAQWSLRNPKFVGAWLHQSVSRMGLTLSGAARTAEQLEAGVFKSNRPPALAMLEENADHNAYWESVCDWMDKGGHIDPWTLDSPRIIAAAAEACVHGWKAIKQFENDTKPRPIKTDWDEWDSPWALASSAEASALGPAAGAPAALDNIHWGRQKLSRSDAIRRLAQDSKGLAKLFQYVGPLADFFLDGKIPRGTSVGLVAPKHTVLVDLALTSALNHTLPRFLRRKKHMQQAMDDIASVIRIATCVFEKELAHHPQWGRQLHY